MRGTRLHKLCAGNYGDSWVNVDWVNGIPWSQTTLKPAIVNHRCIMVTFVNTGRRMWKFWNDKNLFMKGIFLLTLFSRLISIIRIISRGRNVENTIDFLTTIHALWIENKRGKISKNSRNIARGGFVKQFYNSGFKIVWLKSENRFRQAR